MDPRNETTIVEGALDEEDDDNDATQDQERGDSLPERFFLPSNVSRTLEESYSEENEEEASEVRTQFRSLRIEETTTESRGSSASGQDLRSQMKLPLQLEDLNSADSEEYEVSQGGIIFSPGGSQAYMFTQASPEDEEASKLTEDQVKPHLPPQSLPSRSKEPPTQPLSQTPREIRDPIFLERHSEDRAILPHGERPKTVGQSADGPTRNRTQQQQQVVQLPPLPNLQTSPPLVAPLPTASKQMTSLKGRLEDLKYSLDQSGVGVGGHPPPDLPSTAESSPRMFPRFSPSRLPMARDQFLNDPDSFNLNLNATESEMTTDDAESLPSPHPGGLPLTDRATSPSVASVVSMASSTASGQTTGRRGLEWDSGADLGYLGGEFAPQNQKDAAASLSTLEKLAIGNYSSYLRTEPEGKPSKAAAAAALAAAGGGATSGRNSNLRQYRQNIEDEKLRQVRLHKFADSLMRQRELRAMASAATSANPAERSESRRRRSKSRESSRKSDSTPEGSPSHGRQKKKRNQYGAAPVKSASLTDLQGGSHDDLAEINFKLRRNFRSNSDVSSHHFLLHQNFRSPLYHSSEPSSCSSSTTVVPIHRSEAATQVEHANLLEINTDPSSLPAHLQEMFQGSLSSKDSPRAMTSSASFDSAAAAAAVTASNPCRSQSSGLEQQGAIRKTSAASSSTNTERLRSQPSQISLGGSSSHQSEASRSYETVVNMGRSSRRSIERNRWVTKSNLLVSDSVEDTEDEIEAIRKAEREHHHHRSSRGNSGGRRREGGAEEDFRPPPERRRQHGAGASRTSSLATTSDEEKHESHRPSRSEGGGRVRAGERADGRKQELQLPATNSSTMESAQIDRAKSFEYFPGESFPIQENSSSYEYLPGHLVNDRPATVVSNYQNEPDFNISGITSLSSTTDQSSDQLDNRGSNRRGEAGGGKRKSSRKDGNAAAGFQDQDLDAIAEELNKRSHALLEAHMNKTKHFYRKMKKYISYVSTPSVTAEDSRKKQEILEKLLGLMAKQESNLESRHLTRPISVQTSVISEESEGRRSDLPTRALESAADLRAESPTIHEKSQISTDCSSTTSHADTQGKRSSLESRSGPAKIVKKNSKNPSSSSGSRTREEKNSTTPRDGDSLPHPNVEIHRQRIEQMRVLRQEIKKLERLECANIKQLVGGKLPFMPEPSDMSDESSLISTSTYVTDPTEKLRSRQQQQASSTTRGGAAGIAKRLGTEGKSSSDSNNAKKKGKSLMSDKVLPGAARVPPGAKPVTKSKYVDIKTKGKASESSQKSLSGRPGNSSSRSVSRATESKSSRSASSAATSKSLADFGQTYPTPREQQPSTVSSSAAQTTAQTNSRGIQTEPRPVQLEIISSPEPKKMPRSKKKKVMKKAPPVAYYLPFSNDSPIKIGTRIIRERIQEEGIGRENRNILANYMAGLDSGAIFRDGGNSRSETATRISSRPRDNDHDDDSSGDFSNLLTLQDALAAKRPDFVAKADQRMHWLHQAKLQRLAMEEKKKQWILDVARMDSKERKMAKPNFSPVKIRRIFNYREMVEKTRQKYRQLPEVRYQAYETKRKSLYQTNRIMKDMYKQKLKENVLGGKVSLNHFKDVIQI